MYRVFEANGIIEVCFLKENGEDVKIGGKAEIEKSKKLYAER